MAESVTRYIEGVCSGVKQTPGSDMVRFEVSVAGKDYPTTLKTKKQEIIDRAKAVGSNHATWKFTERESSNINPHNNKPYMDRFLDNVKQGSHTPEGYVDPVAPRSSSSGSTGDGDQPQQEFAPGRSYTEEDIKRFDDKERRSYMSKAWAHTLSMLAHTVKVDADLDQEFARLQSMQRKIYTDICGLFSWPEDDRDVPFETGGEPEEWSSADAPVPDDDIPF